jgi:predicted permease
MEFRNLLKGKLAFICSFSRLILIPLITFAVLSIMPIAYRDIKLTMLIAASAPVGANIAIFAQLYGQDYNRAVQCVCLSTILSITTLPVIVGLAGHLW